MIIPYRLIFSNAINAAPIHETITYGVKTFSSMMHESTNIQMSCPSLGPSTTPFALRIKLLHGIKLLVVSIIH